MSSGYIIATVEVTNPTQYEDYKKWSTEAMRAHGAEVCVRGGALTVIEGDWSPSRLVVLKFPSYQKAQAFAASPEYDKARVSRQGAAIMQMVAVEGV